MAHGPWQAVRGAKSAATYSESALIVGTRARGGSPQPVCSVLPLPHRLVWGAEPPANGHRKINYTHKHSHEPQPQCLPPRAYCVYRASRALVMTQTAKMHSMHTLQGVSKSCKGVRVCVC
jgi:hypothetical protein